MQGREEACATHWIHVNNPLETGGRILLGTQGLQLMVYPVPDPAPEKERSTTVLLC